VLLDARRRVEDACAGEFERIERERAQRVAELQGIERTSFARDAAPGPAPAGQYAVIEWCALHAAAALEAARERLHRCIPAWEAARLALCAARLERRVLEKLEERYERAKRLRRARRESADIDEGNMLVRLR